MCPWSFTSLTPFNCFVKPIRISWSNFYQIHVLQITYTIQLVLSPYYIRSRFTAPLSIYYSQKALSYTFDELLKPSLMNVVLIQLVPFLGACNYSESQYLPIGAIFPFLLVPLYFYHLPSQFNFSIQCFFF